MGQDLRHRDIVYFARLMANQQGISIEAAELFIRELFQLLKEGLIKDNYVHLSGLGTFKIINKDKQGDDTKIAYELIFVPDGELQSIINKPFEHFESVVIYSDTLKEQLWTQKEEAEDEKVEDQTDINSKQMMEESNEKKIGNKKQSETQVKNIEDSFIGIYGDDKEAMLEGEADLNELKDQLAVEIKEENSSVESKRVQQNQKSSSVWALSFIIVILSLLVLLLAFRLQSVQKELNAYVSQRTEFYTLEKGKSETIILYPDTTEAQDSLSGGSDQLVGEIQETVAGTTLDPYEIPSLASLQYTIVGTLTTHQVVPGETLRILAEVYYGSREMWPYIYYYNEDQIKTPNQLLKNSVLKIPKLENFQSGN